MNLRKSINANGREFAPTPEEINEWAEEIIKWMSHKDSSNRFQQLSSPYISFDSAGNIEYGGEENYPNGDWDWSTNKLGKGEFGLSHAVQKEILEKVKEKLPEIELRGWDNECENLARIEKYAIEWDVPFEKVNELLDEGYIYIGATKSHQYEDGEHVCPSLDFSIKTQDGQSITKELFGDDGTMPECCFEDLDVFLNGDIGEDENGKPVKGNSVTIKNQDEFEEIGYRRCMAEPEEMILPLTYEYIGNGRYAPISIDHIDEIRFSPEFLEELKTSRFTGDVEMEWGSPMSIEDFGSAYSEYYDMFLKEGGLNFIECNYDGYSMVANAATGMFYHMKEQFGEKIDEADLPESIDEMLKDVRYHEERMTSERYENEIGGEYTNFLYMVYPDQSPDGSDKIRLYDIYEEHEDFAVIDGELEEIDHNKVRIEGGVEMDNSDFDKITQMCVELEKLGITKVEFDSPEKLQEIGTSKDISESTHGRDESRPAWYKHHAEQFGSFVIESNHKTHPYEMTGQYDSHNNILHVPNNISLNEMYDQFKQLREEYKDQIDLYEGIKPKEEQSVKESAADVLSELKKQNEQGKDAISKLNKEKEKPAKETDDPVI